MQCDERYYEADTGYMCWINKKPCNKNNCTLKHKFAKEFSKKVVKILRIDFWDMETDNKKVMKVGKYE